MSSLDVSGIPTALRLQVFGSLHVSSFEPRQLNSLQRRQHADGTGDLIFSQHAYRDSDGDRRVSTIGFMAVPNVKDVEDRVRELAGQQAEEARR